MSEAEVLREKIHEANIAVHQVEASYYNLFHPEVYSKQEQKRVTATLSEIDGFVADNQKRALDFGAGTGNITGKLLALGYTVTAVDISPAMCTALQNKYQSYVKAHKLTVINAPVEEVDFGVGKFDLITCYSVLHHLPDYEETLRRLCGFLKKGGIMFLDHEASPFFWRPEPTMLTTLVKSMYFHSNPMLNSFYFQIIGFKAPPVDYSLSDYWFKREHSLNHQRIQQIFKKEKFESYTRTDYHLRESWIFNPIYWVYRHICRPETSYWIAKK
ncbi:MAG: class I SAM-dependent methyltransferase [Candidatus Bathyarchaeota archaeon]|nr:class I SAM-dependent methyltransferase [Candidatus Bathyarchaeota archaeon]